ncbi:MAG: permease prefix domain 1-containing protein [Pirellulales bacterium]|nr:permease prefix domain 1-containing protein [Pirellulales bacterium]
MNIQHTVQQYLPFASLQTTAEIDAEIREELELHLHMRTQDNVRAGMSAEEARQDANQRFGDFEVSRRACRKITLGPRLMLHRLQTGLLIVLLGTVVYQAVLLFNLQTSSRNQIESLTELVEELRAGGKTVKDEATIIPYVQWNLKLHNDDITATHGSAGAKELNDWSTVSNPMQQPWSDWSKLDKQTKSE